MDTVKLEKQIRIVPLLACIVILVLRQVVEDPASTTMLWISIALALVATFSLFGRIYLEKKNGTFIASRYYLLWFFLIFAIGMFIYSSITI